MRLRTFESFGLMSNGILHSYPSLQHNESCEVVVVGAGITGALVSHALMEKGYNVLLLDKRDIASGSTAATTSMLQYETDMPLYKLAGQIGEEGAVACYTAGIEAIYQLRDLVAKHGFDCGFEMKESLYIARKKEDAVWLKTEYQWRNNYNLSVKWLEATEVWSDYGIKCHGAILSQVAGSVDAYRLAHGLIAFNAGRGMKVFDQTCIDTFKFEEKGAVLITDTQHTLSCKRIVFCTGYEATTMIKEKIAGLFYTYACVSEQNAVLPEKVKKTLVWDTGDPYLYMRSTNDGRLLVGGADLKVGHHFFQQRIKERKAQHLQKQLKAVLPRVQFVEDFSWAGTFGATKDSLPYIGLSPQYKQALFALGFGGNGIVFSVQAMHIITDLLAGKENALSRWYRFGR